MSIDRHLIRKLVNNIHIESQYIDEMMELADRKNPESAIALSQKEKTEIVLLFSQTDCLHDYLKDHGVLK